MKKMYNLLTMLVLFLMGSTSMMASRDNRYQVAGGSTGSGQEWTVDNIETDVDFVLQSGKAALAGNVDFVRGLGKSTFLNDKKLFQLESAGEDADGEAMYYFGKKRFQVNIFRMMLTALVNLRLVHGNSVSFSLRFTRLKI